MTLGDVQAFIMYSRQFTMPITQIASQMNLLQSGLASAERVFEFLYAGEEEPDVAGLDAAVDFTTPITAAARTSGCCRRQASTSAG